MLKSQRKVIERHPDMKISIKSTAGTDFYLSAFF